MLKNAAGQIISSPSDLIRFMESPFASWMARLHLEFRDRVTPDPESEEKRLIAETGDRHEAKFLAKLKSQGRDICEIARGPNEVADTIAALKSGREIIFQACLASESFQGYADFLVRVTDAGAPTPVYEIWDTKLARKPKPYYLVQLCAYVEMLESLRRIPVRKVRVVLGDETIPEYNPVEFNYYYLQLKSAFLRQMEDFNPDEPPMPDPRSDHGRWASHAQAKLNEVDHLALVAGISVGQIKKFNAAGIMTVTDLARSGDLRIPRLHQDMVAKLADQANLQIETRDRRERAGPDELVPPAFRVLPPPSDQPRRGLALLPPPSSGDVFFDMEGFPLVDGGLEYLFGATVIENGRPSFHDWWAHDTAEEKVAFEGFVDWAYARWKADPAMHIYHYANYEVKALRRLMGKYATREDEVDDFLRNGVFVDLYQVVRQGLRVGEPNYSIKAIEHLYRPARAGPVATAGESIVRYAQWIESDQPPGWQHSAILGGIRDYNQEDCESTWQLANWLRDRKRESRIHFVPMELNASVEKPPDPEKEKWLQERKRLFASLDAKASADTASEESRIATMLRDLLEFHRREEKPVWWRLFERESMTHEELKDDIGCIGEAELLPDPPTKVKQSWIHSYRFDPDQETKVKVGDSVMPSGNLDAKFEIVGFDENGRVDLKIGQRTIDKKLDGAVPRRTSFLPSEVFNSSALRDSIESVAMQWDQTGLLPQALRRFLLRLPPDLPSTGKDGALCEAGEGVVDAAVRIVQGMRRSTLCIQGPPGTGKTFTAAKMIATVLREGKRVGVTSNSHNAIFNLLRACNENMGAQLNGVKVGKDTDDEFFVECPGARPVEKTADAKRIYTSGVVAGTAWLFARPEWSDELDYLFVDEAGQVSTGHLVSMARSTANIVLLGDQMQLEQPTQGSHPGESGSSALSYFLQGHATIPASLGLFLPETRRMHPEICRFVSELVYEGRLTSSPGTERRLILPPSNDTKSLLSQKAGIAFSPVVHDGNIQASDEEVERIVSLANDLLGRSYTDETGAEAGELTWDDLLFVAPYNMQVRRLRDRLGPDARVGSVDKFQGQEAAVVFVSMCSSFGEYGSRGIEFILDQNRMNVAISRARILAVVVGDPRIATAPATSIATMRRLNLYCRLVQDHSIQSIQ